MPASTSRPAGSDSGNPHNTSGGSKDVQKVDKGKRRRSDSEERRAAEEEEEERLQAVIAVREADLEAADSALAEQIRRRIERNEEERRELLRRQAVLHSSRPWLPSVTPAATPAPPAVPVAPKVAPPEKRGRGRPPKSGKMEIEVGSSGGAEENSAMVSEIAGIIDENPGALPAVTESAPEGERETAKEMEAENSGEGPTVVAVVGESTETTTERPPIAEKSAEKTTEKSPVVKEEEEDFSMDASQQAIVSKDGQRFVPVWVPTRRLRKIAVMEPTTKGGQAVFKLETADNVIPPIAPGPGTQDDPIEIEDDSEGEGMDVDSEEEKNDSEGVEAPK
ncbi:hypothetical protein GGX14DRAFT_560813 [Mycena pura]|uniref:Uncharacterized protein n=1 Tax=Mycena pura TaxID=153505 RepID=A0AAD6VNQ9_9AGAR|nr:hypothetical protein GGX14DRAFT_560813 [Mycena pura]